MLRLFPYRIEYHRAAAIVRHAGYRVAAHVHADHELLLVRSGTYRTVLNGAELALRPGELLAVLPGDRHEDRCHGPVGLATVNFAAVPGPHRGRSADLAAPGLPPAARRIPGCAGLAPRFERILAEARHGDPLSPMLLDALCLELACELLRRLPPGSIAPALAVEAGDRRFRQQVLACFEARLGRRTGLADLARDLGLRRSALAERCRRLLGDAPMRLFRRFAIDRARVLVERGDLTLAEIAEAVGFANPFHLSVVYKRIHGVPPSAHRG